MSAESAISTIVLLLIAVGVGTTLILAPNRDPRAEVEFSQSLARPEFVQWETNSEYQVDSVEVYDNGKAIVRLRKGRK